MISARTEPVYGNIVTLRHSGGIRTRYGHLASIDPEIQPGATVTIGQKLGVEGSTGTSTGLHLHFQVEINGRPVDPVPFMADRGAPLDGTAVAPNPQTPSPASLGPSERQARGRRGVPAARTRPAATGLAAQPAAAHPGQDQKPVHRRSGQNTRSPGPCWPASAWKKPVTAATTAPAPPAPKG